MNTKPATAQRILLGMAGSLLILVATRILATPVAFFGSNAIDLGSNVSLINELKAPAGLLLASGVFMVGAAFNRARADTATWLASLIYLSYAASRLVSMAVDGVPAAGLVQAMALEAAIGLACLAVLALRRCPKKSIA
jgi:hypothetical protein